MSNYGVFAKYYDRLTENAEYEVRSDYISDFLYAAGIHGGAMLELACGTGAFTEYFTQKGFQVTGLDLSEDMLTVAKAKCPEATYLKADISDFALPEKYDVCISCLDSINHLVTEEEWRDCFVCTAKALKKGALFIFDVNTVHKHNEILAENAFIFDEDGFFLAWDNESLGDGKVRIWLDFFIDNGQSYDRFTESFSETAFPTEKIKEMLVPYFEILGVYNDLSKEPEQPDSERLYFICKRK